MKILAINSSHDQLSIALNRDGEIAIKEVESQRSHNQHVLALIDSVLAENNVELRNLDAVAFGEGPGSFTGLRMGAAVAQGLAFGLDIPAIGVSCMAAVAQSTPNPRVAVALDAKGNSVFWAAYEKNESEIVSTVVVDSLVSISDVSLPGSEWHGAGVGWDSHCDEFLSILGDSVNGWTKGKQPHAQEVSIIGAAIYGEGMKSANAKLAVPNYLFPFSATK